MLRKKEWSTRVVRHATAANLIAKHHYSKGTANTSQLAVGLFRQGDFWNASMYGASMWMWAPYMIGVEFGLSPNESLSLRRLAIKSSAPKNSASYLIGRSISHIRVKLPKVKLLVTYADTWRGHVGSIYKATNWEYVGETEKTPRWVDEQGMLVSLHAKKSRTRSWMDEHYTRVGSFAKHKYILWI